MGEQKSRFIKLAIIIAIMLVLFNIFTNSSDKQKQITLQDNTYTKFINDVREGKIEAVSIIEKGRGLRELKAVTKEAKSFSILAPSDPGLINDLLKYNVKVVAQELEEGSFWGSLFISWFPMLLLVGVWIYFMRKQMGGGGGKGGIFGFSKSKMKMLTPAENTITFDQVAGCDEAKTEVQEVVEFLKNPEQFSKLGAKLPKGVLLTGSPGTGKTLLAKAIAKEAGVPFFFLSGADFVEMFVGVGASRVRDMFEEAKKNAPCIIFIDEIDAIGGKRSSHGMGGGNDEREQTLNAILVEMDGFGTHKAVIVIGATNRPDMLDPALVRPGRLDRNVVVPLPDVKGRAQILKIHSRQVPLDATVDLNKIARGTPGFSGADLANLINEASLFAARRKKKLVDQQDIESAKDRIMMGAERRSMVMPEKEKINTAYHESGHAVVGKILANCDPVHKVTIIPRGRALGVTMSLPAEDRYAYDREYMLDQISMLMGGRLAEEIFLNHMTTGASNDIERATSMARAMVTQYGMSAKLGPLAYGERQSNSFLGSSHVSMEHLAPETKAAVDAEILRIVTEQYAVAKKVLEDNKPAVEAMAKALLEVETIDDWQIENILKGRHFNDNPPAIAAPAGVALYPVKETEPLVATPGVPPAAA